MDKKRKLECKSIEDKVWIQITNKSTQKDQINIYNKCLKKSLTVKYSFVLHKQRLKFTSGCTKTTIIVDKNVQEKFCLKQVVFICMNSVSRHVDLQGLPRQVDITLTLQVDIQIFRASESRLIEVVLYQEKINVSILEYIHIHL
eukprot:TRINITY_DN11742_c0_g4_i1.p3 TRINITY_DN11742_c0_g4~~TRINITY_DN11742_c0_g4_i1.p3  ORF type:complete len:144 (+),score=1.56 TRINITY_DN11742_c0_g4_i1:108-539(+)